MLDLIIVLKTLNRVPFTTVAEKYAKPKLYMQQIREFYARVQYALHTVHTAHAHCTHIHYIHSGLFRLGLWFWFSFPFDVGVVAVLSVNHRGRLYWVELVERVQTFNNEIECNQAKDIENIAQ